MKSMQQEVKQEADAKARLARLPVTSVLTPTDLAANFAKGIKLDDAKFPKLEARGNFIVWKRDTKAVAKNARRLECSR
jgi:hypothetical protein